MARRGTWYLGKGMSNIFDFLLLSLKYSLLQTVVEACQKKRQCRISMRHGNEQNPCAPRPHKHLQQFIELSYKCRPNEFRSKVACNGEKITLSCNPGSRVAVYSAVYGRTEYETLHCPQPSGVPEETCVAEGGTRTVMRACHGQRNCVLTVTPELFIHPMKKHPCKHPNTKPYLYIIYTCVPRRVLAEEYEEPLLSDEDEIPSEIDILEEGYDKADFRAAYSPSPNLVGPQSGTLDSSVTSHNPLLRTPLSKEDVGLSTDADSREKNDQDEGTVYVWLGICCGVLVALGAVLTRVIFYQLHHRQPLPHDVPHTKCRADIAAIEADLDLTSLSSMQKKRSVPHVVEDTITYTKDTRFPLTTVSATHRAMGETSLVPRKDLVEAPLRSGQTLFYPA